MLKSRKGQASLILIVVIALGFIFYAIELNWSKVSNWKMTTWMSATSASSQIASNFASYGERVLWENLLVRWPYHGTTWNGGNVTHVEKSWGLILQIIVFAIAIAVVVWTWGLTAAYLPMLIATTGMLGAAMILQVAVIDPMQFSLWNKLQKNLTISNQFQESGLGAGLQMIVTDAVVLPDRLDWNTNGRWVDSVDPGATP
ncbi:MAG: hypothetical protein HQL15_10305, partial [Candidatus Omnitrophica bacterium]|nr:hypothetical protein [Candidatus Omnitrophota bacterium]